MVWHRLLKRRPEFVDELGAAGVVLAFMERNPSCKRMYAVAEEHWTPEKRLSLSLEAVDYSFSGAESVAMRIARGEDEETMSVLASEIPSDIPPELLVAIREAVEGSKRRHLDDMMGRLVVEDPFGPYEGKRRLTTSVIASALSAAPDAKPIVRSWLIVPLSRALYEYSGALGILGRIRDIGAFVQEEVDPTPDIQDPIM